MTWTVANQAPLSSIIYQSLLQLMFIQLVMLSNHLFLCHSLLLLPSVFPSIRVLSSESDLHIRWPNYWNFNSASVLPMNIQSWFPLWLTYSISLLSKELSRVFSNTTVRKHQFFGAQPSLQSNSYIHIWLLEKPQLWLFGPLSAKWCVCFLMWSRFVIVFFPRSKCLLISWLQSLSVVILLPREIKSVTVSIVSPSIC